MGPREDWLHDPSRADVYAREGGFGPRANRDHPFADGNGRVGRLLVTLLLCVEGVSSESPLYRIAVLDRAGSALQVHHALQERPPRSAKQWRNEPDSRLRP